MNFEKIRRSVTLEKGEDFSLITYKRSTILSVIILIQKLIIKHQIQVFINMSTFSIQLNIEIYFPFLHYQNYLGMF